MNFIVSSHHIYSNTYKCIKVIFSKQKKDMSYTCTCNANYLSNVCLNHYCQQMHLIEHFLWVNFLEHITSHQCWADFSPFFSIHSVVEMQSCQQEMKIRKIFMNEIFILILTRFSKWFTKEKRKCHIWYNQLWNVVKH